MTRVYIVQKATAILDLEKSVNDAVAEISSAASKGADLIAFPETWLGGYPAWVFGLAGWDDAEARRWYGRLVSESATANGKHLARIRQAAKEHSINVVLGFNERVRETGATLYNSAAFIKADGQLAGVHRKLTPTHTERIVWAPGDAEGLTVHATTAGRIGGLVCWEHFHPIIRQGLHAADEEIHVALWPDMTSAHQLASRHYAFEGRCFVLAAATYLDIQSVPADLREAYAKGVGGDGSFNGGSGVIGPDGEYIVGPIFGPDPVIADIDLSQTIAYKHDLDVAGHYDRPDILRWSIERRGRSGDEPNGGPEKGAES
jgi:predicted amidohydrolase